MRFDNPPMPTPGQPEGSLLEMVIMAFATAVASGVGARLVDVVCMKFWPEADEKADEKKVDESPKQPPEGET